MPSETFREVKCLPMKYYFVVEGNKRVQDIAYKNKRITELFYCTKEIIQPESLNLSLKIKDKER